MRSAIGQILAHLTNFVRIWSIGKIDQMRSAFGQTRSAIGQMRVRLAKRARIWPNARAIYKTLRIWSNSARLTNWSNAQIGQMRLTIQLISLNLFVQHLAN